MSHLLAEMYIYVKGHLKWSTCEVLAKSKQIQATQEQQTRTTLVEHQDLLIPAKFQFFSFIVGILKSCPVIFQSDSPLLPFMFDEISLILDRLVWLVYKKKKVDDALNLRKVMNKEFLTNQSN